MEFSRKAVEEVARRLPEGNSQHVANVRKKFSGGTLVTVEYHDNGDAADKATEVYLWFKGGLVRVASDDWSWSRR